MCMNVYCKTLLEFFRRTEDSFKKRRRNVGNKPRPSPFRGYLMNRIECTQCSYKVSLFSLCNILLEIFYP